MDTSPRSVQIPETKNKKTGVTVPRLGMKMQAVIIALLGLFGITKVTAQDVVARFPTTNNLEQGQIREHTVTGEGGLIDIMNNGGDGIANFKIEIYDSNNNLKETLQWGGDTYGTRETLDKIKYYAENGNGNSCDNGGKDRLYAGDWNDNSYDNSDQCVKLPITTPIELQHFLARCVQEGQQVRFVEMTRSTQNETNNEGFRVQKSADGKTRVNIAWVDGAGTSRDIENYSFIDPKGTDGDPDGVVYYRLQDVSGDGVTGYSDIEVVQDCDSGEGYDVTAYPNPCTDKVTLRINPTDRTLAQTVIVRDMLGHVVGQVSASDANEIVFDISGKPAGLYTIQVVEGNGNNAKTIKVQKQ